MEDAGAYECKASNAAGFTTLTAHIEIQQPPILSMEPDRQVIDVTEGDELRFTCSATGIPSPTVTVKPPENFGSILSILPPTRGFSNVPEASVNHRNIRMHQAGIYECLAINEAGQDLRYIQVNVNPKRGDVGKFRKLKFVKIKNFRNR